VPASIGNWKIGKPKNHASYASGGTRVNRIHPNVSGSVTANDSMTPQKMLWCITSAGRCASG
jgi:hypothetical protein